MLSGDGKRKAGLGLEGHTRILKQCNEKKKHVIGSKKSLG